MSYPTRDYNCVPTQAPYQEKFECGTTEIEREIPQVVQRLEYSISELSEAIDAITARLLFVMSPAQDVNKQGTPIHATGTGLGGSLQEQVNRIVGLNLHVRDIRNRLQV